MVDAAFYDVIFLSGDAKPDVAVRRGVTVRQRHLASRSGEASHDAAMHRRLRWQPSDCQLSLQGSKKVPPGTPRNEAGMSGRQGRWQRGEVERFLYPAVTPGRANGLFSEWVILIVSQAEFSPSEHVIRQRCANGAKAESW
jgi:hypothetical protein